VEYIEDLLQIFEIENLKDRELKLDFHKWHFLENATFFNYFTIEKVLAFLQKLFIAERWIHLDPEKGREIFKKLFRELKSGFEFPEEYTLSYGKTR
jgi:ABC-type nitrate/sulfonate/bicarbonate transport system substrate-binding protein